MSIAVANIPTSLPMWMNRSPSPREQYLLIRYWNWVCNRCWPYGLYMGCLKDPSEVYPWQRWWGRRRAGRSISWYQRVQEDSEIDPLPPARLRSWLTMLAKIRLMATTYLCRIQFVFCVMKGNQANSMRLAKSIQTDQVREQCNVTAIASTVQQSPVFSLNCCHLRCVENPHSTMTASIAFYLI